MKHVISLIVLSVICQTGFGYIHPDIRDEIRSCRIIFNADSVLPGSTLKLSVNTVLSNGYELSSASGVFSPNLSDYRIHVSGQAELVKKNRKYFWIKIEENAWSDPFIRIDATLKKNKEITCREMIRIRMEAPVYVNYSGQDGYDPATSTEEARMEIFNTGVYLSLGYPNTLSYHSGKSVDGEDAPDLDVYLRMEQLENQREMKLRADIIDSEGKVTTKYIDPVYGELIISSIGGNGGTSTFGAKGGRGGDVTVYYTREAQPYLSRVYIRNFGGNGGPLWRPSHEGQSGPCGMPGETSYLAWDGKSNRKL